MAKKTESRLQNCSDCGGSGNDSVECSSCGGTGNAGSFMPDSNQYAPCNSCDGSGLLDTACGSCGGSGQEWVEVDV